MELLHHLPRPADAVYAHLTDMRRFVAAHPVIYRADELAPGRYRIHERLLGVPFTYPATVVPDAPARTVTMRATVAGLVTIAMTFRVVPDPADARQCHVHETVTFGGRLPVSALMEPLFRRLHAALFRDIGAAG